MKYSVLIKCNIKDYSYVLKKIFQNNIDIIDSYKKKDDYFFVMYENDYQVLENCDYKKAIILQGYKGIYNIINLINYNLLYIITTLLIILIMFLSNNIIVKVNVYTNNINLNKKIKYYLMDYGIKDISIKKDYKLIQKVKNKILDQYKDDIEWIEITPNGYNYNVYLIERKKDKLKLSNDKCNYIAKKSGTITRINASRGVLLVDYNNYVNQGDILISGQIIYNDELKKEICAKGRIYGEVWYESTIAYPLKESEVHQSKNKFYNLKIKLFDKKYIFFKNKYSNQKNILNIGNDRIGLEVISSSKEYKKTHKLSENEATKKALDKLSKSITTKSHNKSKIISQNILKKYVKNDTIYLKVLVTVEEELGVVERY